MSTLPTSPSYDLACDISDNWDLKKWRPILDIICIRHDISAIKFSQNFEGTNPVFELTLDSGLVDSDLDRSGAINKAFIVKILAPNFHAQYQSDYLSLKLLNHHTLGVKVPKLFYSGDIDNWPYLVIEKLDGVMLSSVLDELSIAEKCNIARELGEFSAQLHQLPERSIEGLRLDWPDFVQLQSQKCYEKRKKQGLPEPLLETLNSYLQNNADKLAPNLNKSCAHLIHTDLHPGNLMVKLHEGRYRFSGIIDFGDALACPDPVFEFTSPALLLALGEAKIFHAYLDGYAYKGKRDSSLQQHMMVLSLLRHTGDINYLLQHVPACDNRTEWHELEPLFFPL
ncbi:aminoglycoside 3'-phosphotransferase/choline kinase family protein [Shewanella eurypsychrophilus]|uniref:Aminoglycoside 3'-phosphotransferase/choline kinase family protein n=1 Tax=Shewanella eurypsychrophilus TaxID=2593656 RepID=A0ABX6VBS9_9GAMM|nr:MULTISPECIES: phosphotransferase [Shewanella]QFU24954.1 phosphotransferase [Shewanella sp. YLB-09]QPG60131.2 aminoglycoside 3'-phosphotransferase/choline kinase family protein [Shewanella eurypsychrophilus]